MRGRLSPALLVLAGCHVGSRAETFVPARGGAGVSVEVALRGGDEFKGELLAVADTGLLLLRDRRIALVRASSARGVRLAQRGDVAIDVKDGRFAPTDALSEARLVSRFPQGLTPELLRRLLAAYGQVEPDVVPP